MDYLFPTLHHVSQKKTIIGGFFFVGSQAWEWSHFIHGTEFGRVQLSDGSSAIVKGEFGEIESFQVIEAGAHSPNRTATVV